MLEPQEVIRLLHEVQTWTCLPKAMPHEDSSVYTATVHDVTFIFWRDQTPEKYCLGQSLRQGIFRVSKERYVLALLHYETQTLVAFMEETDLHQDNTVELSTFDVLRTLFTNIEKTHARTRP